MSYRPGLRVKLNLVVVPLTAAITVLMVWADYRHEVAAVTASHALHRLVVGTDVSTGPIDPATLPEVVGRGSLRMHIAYGVAMLVLLIGSVNAALHAFVLRPIDRIRECIVKMKRGHWRGAVDDTSEDELGQLVRSFQVLGLEIDALVSQLLQAERLSMLALLSKRLGGQLEPDVRRVGEIAARLHRHGDATGREAGQELARVAAYMLAALRAADRAFPQAAAPTDRRSSIRASVLER